MKAGAQRGVEAWIREGLRSAWSPTDLWYVGVIRGVSSKDAYAAFWALTKSVNAWKGRRAYDEDLLLHKNISA